MCNSKYNAKCNTETALKKEIRDKYFKKGANDYTPKYG